MQPTAVQATVADWNPAFGLQAQGPGQRSVTTEKPQIPASVIPLQHFSEILIQRLKIVFFTQTHSIRWIAHNNTVVSTRWWCIPEIGFKDLDDVREPSCSDVVASLLGNQGILFESQQSRGMVKRKLPLLCPLQF